MESRILRLLDGILRGVCAALMGLLALAVILSVFFRYVLSLTTVWSEELITVLFIATTFLGTAMVSKDNDHIAIEFLFEALPARAVRAVRIFVSLIVITVMAVVFQASLRWIAVSGDLRTTGLDLPFRWLYSLLPVSCVLVVLIEIGKIVGYLGKVSKGIGPSVGGGMRS
jgi:TRAP-type C4-dicarboxylate transport system permease small subunit